MSASKRLDLRFGAFACSVQGFDDPVPPVQQILRAIQHLLEESPELSDTAISFDAEAIEQLVGEVARRSELEESQVEIVPGLIIIHHGAGGDLSAGELPASDWSAEREEGAAWADEESGGEGGDYVNIFAPAQHDEAAGGDEARAGDDAETDAGAEAGAGTGAQDEPEEDFADRLRRMASGTDQYGWDEDEDEDAESRGSGDAAGYPSEPDEEQADEDADEDDDEDDEQPLNLFSPVPGEDAAGDETGEAAGEAAEEQATRDTAGASVRNLFAVGGEGAAEEPSPHQADRAAEAGGPDEGLAAADFAKRAGAESVPELMVASAAWMVLVQGQTSFTRRDVLDVFETIPGEHENTAEARIKGFGKAVRNGQLVSTGEGIFGLARSEVERFQDLL